MINSKASKVIFLKSAIAVSVATFILAGCGKGGDAISFVMNYEKLEFIPAIEKLAKNHNINLIYEKQTEEQIKKEEEKKTLFDE